MLAGWIWLVGKVCGGGLIGVVLEQGLSKAEAARVFGVSRTSVHAWVDLYQKNGAEGLAPKRPGRPRGGGQLQGCNYKVGRR